MDKMTLIVFAETGHVLGAFTRTADPEGAVEAAAVVGDGLLIRDADSGGRLLTVEPQHLAVEIVDREDRVLLAHHRYAVVDGDPQEQPAQTGAPVVLDGMEVKLTPGLPGGGAPEDLEAWVQVQGPGIEPVVAKVKIESGDVDGTASMTLPPGPEPYDVLALVPGFRAFVGKEGVP